MCVCERELSFSCTTPTAPIISFYLRPASKPSKNALLVQGELSFIVCPPAVLLFFVVSILASTEHNSLDSFLRASTTSSKKKSMMLAVVRAEARCANSKNTK